MKTHSWRSGVVLHFSIGLLGSIIILGFFIKSIIADPEFLTDIAFILALIICLVLIGIYDFVTISYFIEDSKKEISIDFNRKEVSIIKYGKVLKFKKADIYECFFVKSRASWNSQNPFLDHNYLVFVLTNRKRIIITNLLIKPKELINGLKLNPQNIESTIPYIDYKIGDGILTERQFEVKVREFYLCYSAKNKEELLRICQNPDVYANYAIEAARRVLKKMH